ncbi:helix-turn-helix domain-containing protein [Nocardia sp. NPDC058518]|uniref:helix-turn-helix domain-containing protein n=1 Tax=Nocardia sp. NPDC058518 TaxID=3346534 RepID=UPI0036632FD4
MAIKWRLDEVLEQRGLKVADIQRVTALDADAPSQAALYRLLSAAPDRLNLSVLNTLCFAAQCTPGELLHYIPDAVDGAGPAASRDLVQRALAAADAESSAKREKEQRWLENRDAGIAKYVHTVSPELSQALAETLDGDPNDPVFTSLLWTLSPESTAAAEVEEDSIRFKKQRVSFSTRFTSEQIPVVVSLMGDRPVFSVQTSRGSTSGFSDLLGFGKGVRSYLETQQLLASQEQQQR